MSKTLRKERDILQTHLAPHSLPHLPPFTFSSSFANQSSPQILKAFALHNTYTKRYYSLKKKPKYNFFVHTYHQYCHSKNTGTLPAFPKICTLNCGQSVLGTS